VLEVERINVKLLVRKKNCSKERKGKEEDLKLKPK
jgi:hypothetical protein